MDLRTKLEARVTDILDQKAEYDKGLDEGRSFMPPSGSIIDVVHGDRLHELPKSYVWFSFHIHPETQVNSLVDLLNKDSYASLIDVLTRYTNPINVAALSYRSGYIHGLRNTAGKVIKDTGYHIYSPGAHIEHSLSTEEEVEVFTQGLFGIPFNNPYDNEGMEAETFGKYSMCIGGGMDLGYALGTK